MSSIHCHNKSEKHVKQSGTAVLESLRRLLLAPPQPNKQSGIHSAAAETSSAAALINSISTERAFKRLKHISTTNSDQNIPFIFVFLVPVPECNLINAAGGRKKERKKEKKKTTNNARGKRRQRSTNIHTSCSPKQINKSCAFILKGAAGNERDSLGNRWAQLPAA